LHLFEQLKKIEIYQELHDSIFFFPKMFKYLKTNLDNKSNKINSVNLIKIESALLNKVSKISRLDSKFSYDLLSFDIENLRKKSQSQQKQRDVNNRIRFDDNKKHTNSSSNFLTFNDLTFDLNYFSESLIQYLNHNIRELVDKSCFTEAEAQEAHEAIEIEYQDNNEKRDASNNKTKKVFHFEDWMKFYLENPYVTFLITYKFFSDYFLFEKQLDNQKETLKPNRSCHSQKTFSSSSSNNFFYSMILLPNNNYNLVNDDSTESELEFNYFDIFQNEKLILCMIEKIKNKVVLAEFMR